MGRKRKSNKKSNKLKEFLTSEIIRFFEEAQDKNYSLKQISDEVGIHDRETRKLVYFVLCELTDRRILKETEHGTFALARAPRNFLGRVDINASGNGYVTPENGGNDVFIGKNNLNKAFPGDLVQIKIFKEGRRPEGKILEIVERAKSQYIGVIDVTANFGFVRPDNPKINVDFYVPKSKLNGAEQGEKVVVAITDWPNDSKNPYAEIIEIIGAPGSNEVEMKSLLLENDIPIEFPKKVLEESESIAAKLDPKEVLKRRDFREVTTFTIDPDTAKDFDDALSVEFLENGNIKVGVHIADVSHYVQDDSPLDAEAQKRGNSVYLVDRVVPMIPENLSNIVCSLRPNEEKFTYSVEFEMTEKGEIQDIWYGRTVIISDHRFTYEEAQEVIERKNTECPYEKEILVLDKLAKYHRKKRLKNGALNIESEELYFKLDKEGNPIGTIKKVSKDAHKLIEEFMLLANKSVAKRVAFGAKSTIPIIYRVHDSPDIEKVNTFIVFLRKFGLKLNISGEDDITRGINELLDSIKDREEYGFIQQMAIKTMQKAAYDVKNVGHYGLGFTHYVHFTSPIRRYADLSVHRVLDCVLHGESYSKSGKLKDIAKHISATERRAVNAERESRKYFAAKFVEDKIGESYDGVVTGVTNWGFYVEMFENSIEGMVSIKALEGDSYYFDEDAFAIIGHNTDHTISLGDHVNVTIAKVDLMKRQIDLTLN
ncbi:MAG: ribonuclease R [Crocinitomicaceae bacterium]|nr:ribonuclease R [Crocinitomicaceae bacterium]